jgi:hypothetical protein
MSRTTDVPPSPDQVPQDSLWARFRGHGACLTLSTVLMLAASVAFLVLTVVAERPVWTLGAQTAVGNPDLARDVFDRRMQLYREGTAGLRLNLKYQAILLVIALGLLARGAKAIRSAKFDREELNLLAPILVTAEFFLPAAMLYLWLEFGYLYLDLIDNHKILVDLIPVLDRAVPGQESSLRLLLSDHFFALDFWFALFDPQYVGHSREYSAVLSRSLGLVKSLGFCFFFGLSHACMLAILCDAYAERMSSVTPDSVRRPTERIIRGSYVVYAVFIVAVLFLTHLEFYFGGRKWNYGQYLILAFGVVLTVAIPLTMPLGRTRAGLGVVPPAAGTAGSA